MKDLFDFKPGWPTTFGGVRALRDFVVDFYCAWAERMERAGAIIVGKTNSPVMGFRGTCDNPLFGPSRNPFDTSRNTGGSSGGSAAAVAAGLLPVAEGTDGGGSIRIRRPGVASTVTSSPSAASRTSRARTPSPASTLSCSRARSPARWRTPRW
jgi:hypothetical protein